MKLTGESKLLLGILVGTIAIIAGAAVLFTKPAELFNRDEIIGQAAHTRGPKTAKAYLVEFSDFQCPACATAKPFVDEVIAKNKDSLLFVYRHFPLDQHPFGMKAAQAAEAAGKQGKFWEMYDLLFANQEKFSDDYFSTLAKTLQLDEAQFQTDMNNSELKTVVENDRLAGIRFGVNSTPTFFLNGRKLELSTFADLKREVENAVK